MKTPPSYSIPLFAIVLVVGWLIWSSLGATASGPTAKPKVTRIETALLSPSLGPSAARDPFRLPAEIAEKSAAEPRRVSAAAPTNPKAAAASKATARPDPKRLMTLWTTIATLLDKKSKEMVARARAEAQQRATIAAQVRLSATSVGGKRRLAILNDRTFAEGEVIDSLGGLTGPIVLAHVSSNSVTLLYHGSPAVVNFASATANSSAPPAPPRPTSPPAKTARSKGNQGRQSTPTRRPSGGRT